VQQDRPKSEETTTAVHAHGQTAQRPFWGRAVIVTVLTGTHQRLSWATVIGRPGGGSESSDPSAARRTLPESEESGEATTVGAHDRTELRPLVGAHPLRGGAAAMGLRVQLPKRSEADQALEQGGNKSRFWCSLGMSRDWLGSQNHPRGLKKLLNKKPRSFISL
jgi:hypothetical protein